MAEVESKPMWGYTIRYVKEGQGDRPLGRGAGPYVGFGAAWHDAAAAALDLVATGHRVIGVTVDDASAPRPD